MYHISYTDKEIALIQYILEGAINLEQEVNDNQNRESKRRSREYDETLDIDHFDNNHGPRKTFRSN